MSVRAASAAFVAAILASTPSVVLACPMCFSGGNSNSKAFLWGSLLLMFVPVIAIGLLVYWAYRRAQAKNDAASVRDAAELMGGLGDMDSAEPSSVRIVSAASAVPPRET